MVVVFSTTLLALAAAGASRSIHVDADGLQRLSFHIDIEQKEEPVTSPKYEFAQGIRASSSRIPKGSTGQMLADYQVDIAPQVHQGFLSEDGKYVRFMNIPYAEPPIGDLRWAPPVAFYDQKDGVNDGSRTAICPQFQPGWYTAAGEFTKDMLLNPNPNLPDRWKEPIHSAQYEKFKPKPELDPRVSEDCLLLDVIVPRKVWDKRDESAWFKARTVIGIHGGGFVEGYKDFFGSPEGLLDAADSENIGTIHVAINYRLGAFGFLGGDKFQDEGGYANAGLYDQRFAMQWVSENIWRFGGDSRFMTVMGQSAGASSIMHHITAGRGSDSRFKPYFEQAIMQSPAFFPQPNSTKNDEIYKTFLKLTGAKDLEELFNVSTTKLMQANADMTWSSDYGLFQFGPTLDDHFVKDLPAKELKAGNFHKGIRTLVGHQKFDGLVFTPPWIRSNDDLRKHIQQLYPAVPDSVLEFINEKYPIKKFSWGKEKLLAVSDFLDDLAVQCNSHWLTEALNKDPGGGFRRSVVYRFAFNAVPAIHGNDLAYTYYPNWTTTPPVNANLAKVWQAALMNFTSFADPNNESEEGKENPIPVWPIYNATERKVMNIGGPKQWYFPAENSYSSGADVLDRDRCDYWIDAPYYPEKKKKAVEFADQSQPKQGL